MEAIQAVIGQEGEYTQDRPLTCWRVNTKTVNPPTLALTPIVNSESPINLNPCMSLHCRRKLEYLQKNPENPHRQREHPTPHRKAAGLDSTQNLFHQTLNRQIISKSSWKIPRTTTFSFKNSLFLYTISESHKLNPSVTWSSGKLVTEHDQSVTVAQLLEQHL